MGTTEVFWLTALVESQPGPTATVCTVPYIRGQSSPSSVAPAISHRVEEPPSGAQSTRRLRRDDRMASFHITTPWGGSVSGIS